MLCEFVTKLRPEAESEAVFSQDSFVCRGCFRKLEKPVKLRSEVGNLESELEMNLKAAVQQLPTACWKTHTHSSFVFDC